jgi:hypothetical protein
MPLNLKSLKWWAQEGEFKRDVHLFEVRASGTQSTGSFLYEDNLCQVRWQYDQAIRYYDFKLKIVQLYREERYRAAKFPQELYPTSAVTQSIIEQEFTGSKSCQSCPIISPVFIRSPTSIMLFLGL